MYSIATIDFVQLDTAVTELHLKQINVPKYDKFNNVGVIESVKQGWIDMVFRRISLILGYVFQTEDEFEWTVCSTFSLAGDAAALFCTEAVCHFGRLPVFVPVFFPWLHSRHIPSHGEVWCLAVPVFFAVRLLTPPKQRQPISRLQKEYARHGRKEYMARHSFIQMSKLSNVKGRISYITSHAKQENLYATYRTADNEFWSNLARESQQEFKRSGTEGKCIEARELIIALPEIYTRYEPQEVLEDFTEEFRRRYGVECVSALHHNKRKTNYHIHLIFSERKLLPEPDIKRATRSVFYDETGKRVRTKKEIIGEDGQIRKGCTVIKKGEVYESHLFTVKDDKFKSEPFLREVKEIYTDLINRHISDPEQQLKVFDKNSVYLPTKKIGMNNPKAAEIEADNTARQEWNRTADMAQRF